MKKKNFFMLALAAIAFAACSNEDIVPGGENGTDVTNSDGDAWVALRVQAIKTRALNTPNQDNGTADESTITAVKAIFFDGHLGASKVTKVVNFTPDDIANLPNRTNAFKVPSASQSVLIVANPQNLALPLIKENETDYDAVNAAITVLSADVTANVAKSGEFVMTNAKGDLEPSDSNGDPEKLTLYNTAIAATNSPLTIRIDRVSAKVRVYVTPDKNETLSDVATIKTEDTKWYLNVTNKKFFPASKRTLTYNETPTPFDQYELGSYRIDPNYQMSEIGVWTNAGDHAKYDENYFYVTSATNTIDWNDLSAAKYCLENTQVEDGNVHAYTTQVLLKVSFAPNDIKNEDGSSPSPAFTNGDDWFSMNGVFYTPTTILTYIKKELKNKYDNEPPSEYATEITDAYNAYIGALGITPVDIPTNLILLTSEAQADDIVAKFVAITDEIKEKSEGGKSLENIEYYSKGLCYYKIMIKHDNIDSPTIMNKLGEFGVVRNSVYDITVNKINNPGYPSIPDPEPGTKDEEEDRYLSIKIEVNPWTWYSQVEPL